MNRLNYINLMFIIAVLLVSYGCKSRVEQSGAGKDFVGVISQPVTPANKQQNADKEQSEHFGYIDLITDVVFRYHRDGWTLTTENAQVNAAKLKRAGAGIILSAVGNSEDKKQSLDDEIALLKKLVDATGGRMQMGSSLNSVLLNRDDTIKVLVLVEGADRLLNADDAQLLDLKRRGVAVVGLVGGRANSLCDVDSAPSLKNGGLTEQGGKFAQRLQDLGIAIDLTHASQTAFYDLFVNAGAIAMVSHSAVRSLREHPRNLDDLQILALKRYGGLMGLVFNPDFLVAGDKGAAIDDVIAHINHIKKLGAIAALALGTDFDGIIAPDGLQDVGDLPKLRDKLAAEGFTNAELDGIFFNNARKFFDNVVARQGSHEISTHDVLRPLNVECDTILGESKGAIVNSCNGFVLDEGPAISSSARLKIRIRDNRRTPRYIEIFGVAGTPWQVEAQNLNGDIILRRGVKLDDLGKAMMRLPASKSPARLFLSPTRPSILYEAVIWGD